MSKSIIEISELSAHLRVRRKQLEILAEDKIQGTIPCEDLGVLVVDQQSVTYTHQALTTLAQSGTVVLLCDASHQPVASILPLTDHNLVVSRLNLQISISLPTKKRLWKQLVQEKIRRQAGNLSPASPAYRRLQTLASQVRPGDPQNREGQAARIYWQNWLEDLPERLDFHRDRFGIAPNNLLNYGYAVIRAALARALVAAGLQPALGIQHSHRSNAFCLADDLIEPLRPLVDLTVRDLFAGGHQELDRYTKAALLERLTSQLEISGTISPFMVAMNRYANSFVNCLDGTAKFLEIPESCTSPDTETCGL